MSIGFITNVAYTFMPHIAGFAACHANATQSVNTAGASPRPTIGVAVLTLSRLFAVLFLPSLPRPSKFAPLFRLGRTHSSVHAPCLCVYFSFCRRSFFLRTVRLGMAWTFALLIRSCQGGDIVSPCFVCFAFWFCSLVINISKAAV